MNLNVPFVMTKSGINVFLNGRMESISSDHPSYDKILNALTVGDVPADEIANLVNVATAVANFSDGRVQVRGDAFFYDGTEMANALTIRIIDLLKKGKDISPLIAFMNNLMDNPSFRAVTELYGFLDACTLPITPDGCFLAYKKVNAEYKSIHKAPDGTQMDNSIGQVVKMVRNQVDENPDQTCSTGLHCCSFEYLQHYGDVSWDKVIIVKVNPKNVVAVPKDYNNQKMRVCEYEVVGELPNDQVTELKDKYTTEEYAPHKDTCDCDSCKGSWEGEDDEDDDYDNDGYEADDETDDEDPTEGLPLDTPTSPLKGLFQKAKARSDIGDWKCRCSDETPDAGVIFACMTANQAKAAFARKYGIDYTDVRVRKA